MCRADHRPNSRRDQYADERQKQHSVNLTSDNGATGASAFYAANTCTSAITTISIALGTNSGSFFYKATTRGSGTHTLTAAATGLTSATQAQTINKADQTITFAALASKTFGDADFTVNATSKLRTSGKLHGRA